MKLSISRDCGSARPDPRIHLEQLTFPEAADTMSGQTPILDPAVHRIGRNPKMGRNFGHRIPAILWIGVADWSRHESTIVAESRQETSKDWRLANLARGKFAFDR